MFVRKFRGQGNALGAAVQLCTLPWLGFVPDEVASAPAAAVARLAERLGTVLGGLDHGVEPAASASGAPLSSYATLPRSAAPSRPAQTRRAQVSSTPIGRAARAGPDTHHHHHHHHPPAVDRTDSPAVSRRSAWRS